MLSRMEKFTDFCDGLFKCKFQIFFSFSPLPVHLFIVGRQEEEEEVDAAFYFARHYRRRIEIQLAHDFPLVLRFAGGRDQSR